MIVELSEHDAELLLRLADAVRASRIGGDDRSIDLSAEVAERVRVMALQLDGDGCLPCSKTALALGRMESNLRWHCAAGSGPVKLKARRGHRHRLSDAIEWERRQAAAATTADGGDGEA